MAKGYEILSILLPEGGWVIYEDNFDSIIYDDGVTPITKEQFTKAFTDFDNLVVQKEIELKAKRQAALEKLAILGLDTDDLAALGL